MGAAGTLLGVQVAEAAQAVGELLAGREALARQRLLARGAHEALPVPRLLPVCDAPGGDGLEEAGEPQSVFQGPPGEGWFWVARDTPPEPDGRVRGKGTEKRHGRP